MPKEQGGKFIQITDKTGIGKLKLVGTYNRQLLDKSLIKRVRLLKRADGFYCQFVLAVSPQYTSQKCSNCGNIVKKTLSVRTHVCECGCVLDRDENAAKNILHKANTVGRTEIQALGQNTHCLDGESLLNKVTG